MNGLEEEDPSCQGPVAMARNSRGEVLRWAGGGGLEPKDEGAQGRRADR